MRPVNNIERLIMVLPPPVAVQLDRRIHDEIDRAFNRNNNSAVPAGPALWRNTMKSKPVIYVSTVVAGFILLFAVLNVIGDKSSESVTAPVIDAVAQNNSEISKKPESSLEPVIVVKNSYIPLEIDLPAPLFIGTLEPVKINRLEPMRKVKRPPFLVPAGAKNVAHGKEVTGTDEFPIIGELEMITDGDKEGSDGSYVELAPGRQDVTVNLDSEYNIYAIVVWHYHKQGRAYKDVVVQLSSDRDFIDVNTVFNNDYDNSAALGVGEDLHYVESNEGKLIDCQGLPARFVKLTSSGNTANDMNHYIEVEVYGLPVATK